MIDDLAGIGRDIRILVRELAELSQLKKGSLLVIGCSTSEVMGQRIGTGGAMQVAEQIFAGIQEVQREYAFAVAYQCCEHLNRALVIERTELERRGYEEVAAIPVANAGGSMAATAYTHMNEPCLAEKVKADAGIDIGDTLIGMHLKAVAVPVRLSVQQLGQAHVVAARTRPKLIGGQRAIYTRELAQSTDRHNCE